MGGAARVEGDEGLVHLGAVGGDLGEVVAAERAQLGRHAARPGPAVGVVLQVGAGGGALGGRLLAQQVVAQLLAPVLGDRGAAGGRQCVQRGVGAGADGVVGNAQQAREIAVGLALLEQELQDRALVGGEGVETGHGGGG